MPKYEYTARKLTAAEIAAQAGINEPGLVVERGIDEDGNATMAITTSAALSNGVKGALDKVIAAEIGKKS